MSALLAVRDLVVRYPGSGGGPFGIGARPLQAVNSVSLTMRSGEALGLVGESGCGKSSLGRAILRLCDIADGSVVFDGIDVVRGASMDIARLREETALIFQDPYGALNPKMTIGAAIAEVLRVHRKVPRQEIGKRVAELLRLVGLAPEHGEWKPGSLSGGQCQRAGIARALAIEPKLIVADECVAALDVSIQGQIINLLLELKARLNLALIFIAHDLALVRRICDRVAVMYLGHIVEEGPTEAVFTEPRHPYTAALIRAIPDIDPDVKLSRHVLPGEPPSPLAPPSGCAFHPRCVYAMPTCTADPPPAMRRRDGRGWACILESGTIRQSAEG